MSGTTVVLIALALAAVPIAVVIGWPLLPVDHTDDEARGEERRADAEDRERELEERLQQSLSAVREIETDHRVGNLSDDDYAALDRAERARAAELLRERDGGAGDDVPAASDH